MKAPSKRWLILTQYYPPEIGAAPIRLRSLARELVKRGFEVEVLTGFPSYPAGRIYPGYEGRWQMREVMDGVPVRRTWIVPGTGKSAYIRLKNYVSFSFSALGPALLGQRPDVLFVESRPSVGMVAILMKWLRGVPYIYHVADLHLEAAQQMGFLGNTILVRLAAIMENLFLRHAWKVSTVSQGFIQRLSTMGVLRERITFLPNGADADFLRPRSPDPELLDRWQCRGKIVFLSVGTHGYIYGPDTLLHAADRLRERSDMIFLILGEGPERSRLMDVARGLGLTNVVFADSLPYAEMDRLYSLAYAAIATIRNTELARNMRLARIFPALSCGVPVIYSGLGETADLITRHGCGLVVPPEDPELLARTVEYLAAAPVLRSKLGQNGRQLVEREYDWSIIVERWLNELGCRWQTADECER